MIATVEITGSGGQHWTPAADNCQRWIQQALECAGRERDCEVSIHLVGSTEAASLNHRYRQRNSATNVLSFPACLPDNAGQVLASEPLGDIVVCPEVVASEARQQHKPLPAHWAHLLIHGTLHLLGYVHDSAPDAAAMEKLEINSLEKLGFPNPYLVG